MANDIIPDLKGDIRNYYGESIFNGCVYFPDTIFANSITGCQTSEWDEGVEKACLAIDILEDISARDNFAVPGTAVAGDTDFWGNPIPVGSQITVYSDGTKVCEAKIEFLPPIDGSSLAAGGDPTTLLPTTGPAFVSVEDGNGGSVNYAIGPDGTPHKTGFCPGDPIEIPASADTDNDGVVDATEAQTWITNNVTNWLVAETNITVADGAGEGDYELQNDGSWQEIDHDAEGGGGDVVRTGPDGTEVTEAADANCYPLFGFQRFSDHEGNQRDAAACADDYVVHETLTTADMNAVVTGGDLAVSSEDSTDTAIVGQTPHHTTAVRTSVNSGASRTGSETRTSLNCDADGAYSSNDASANSQTLVSLGGNYASTSSTVIRPRAANLGSSAADAGLNSANTNGNIHSVTCTTGAAQATNMDSQNSTVDGQGASNIAAGQCTNSANRGVNAGVLEVAMDGQEVFAAATARTTFGANTGQAVIACGEHFIDGNRATSTSDFESENVGGLGKGLHSSRGTSTVNSPNFSITMGSAPAGSVPSSAARTILLESTTGTITAEGGFVTAALPNAVYFPNETEKTIPYGCAVALVKGGPNELPKVRAAKKADVDDENVVMILPSVSPGAHQVHNDSPFGIDKWKTDRYGAKIATKDEAFDFEPTDEYRKLFDVVKEVAKAEIEAVADAQAAMKDASEKWEGFTADAEEVFDGHQEKMESALKERKDAQKKFKAEREKLTSSEKGKKVDTKALEAFEKEAKETITRLREVETDVNEEARDFRNEHLAARKEYSKAFDDASTALKEAVSNRSKKVAEVESEVLGQPRSLDRKNWTLLEVVSVTRGVKASQVDLLSGFVAVSEADEDGYLTVMARPAE